MSEGNGGKVAGGAALGAGGILVAILKSGSAEVHAVQGATQVARVAEGAGHAGMIGARAGTAAEGIGQVGARGARVSGVGMAAAEGAGTRAMGIGLAGAVEHAPTIERAALASTSDLSLTSMTGRAVEPSAGAAKAAAPAAKNAVTPASRAAKVHDALDRAGDAKDLLERLNDVWDLAQKLDDDDERAIEAKFSAQGLDFRGDVVPSFRGEPAALQGATRTLLTDGQTLVPALKLVGFPATTHTIPGDLRYQTTAKIASLDPSVVLYAERLDPSVANATDTGTPLLLKLASSQAVVWSEVTTAGLLIAPRIVDVGNKRFAAVVPGPTHRSQPVTRLVFVSAKQ